MHQLSIDPNNYTMHQSFVRQPGSIVAGKHAAVVSQQHASLKCGPTHSSSAGLQSRVRARRTTCRLMHAMEGAVGQASYAGYSCIV